MFTQNQIEQQLLNHQAINQHAIQNVQILTENQMLDSQDHMQRHQVPI